MTWILNLGHKRQYPSLLALLFRTSAFGALSLHVRTLATTKSLCWDYTEIKIVIPDPSFLDFPAQVPDL